MDQTFMPNLVVAQLNIEKNIQLLLENKIVSPDIIQVLKKLTDIESCVQILRDLYLLQQAKKDS